MFLVVATFEDWGACAFSARPFETEDEAVAYAAAEAAGTNPATVSVVRLKAGTPVHQSPVVWKDPRLGEDEWPIVGRAPAPAPAPAPATVDDRTDECVYCGRCQGQIDPNTGRGVSRIGFDCFWCGSN